MLSLRIIGLKGLGALTFCLVILSLSACDSSDSSDGEVVSAPIETTLDGPAAARFLTQATFGPTQGAIDALIGADLESWINQQMALPASETLPYVKANSNGSLTSTRHEIWWSNAILNNDQLRQRVAFALSQIFVISDIDYVLSNNQYSVSSYYDMLAKEAFGNYRELLEKVTLHPAMGIYLSMVRNEKANPELNIRPDENYAREVLQLFSIGLVELDASGQSVPASDPLPAYTQKTVEEFARVFTGWNHPGIQFWDESTEGNPLELPMQPFAEYHDSGAKTLLNGQVNPAGLSARADLEAALDNIFMHQNVGPFFSTLLIQRLVTSNPTPAYIKRVAAVFNDNGEGVRGDLGALIKAILLDPEARTGHLSIPEFGKLKEPVIKLIQYFRALDAIPGNEAAGLYHSATSAASRIDELLGQGVMRAGSVFNFYQPDNAVSSNESNTSGRPLVAPEQQIMTESNVASTNNDTHSAVYTYHSHSGISSIRAQINIDTPLQLLRQSSHTLLDYLDLLLLSGQMSDGLRQGLLEHMNNLAAESVGTATGSGGESVAGEAVVVDDATATAQVLDTLYLILASPEYMVQR